MDAGGDGDAGRAKGLDIAALVHRYGRSFVHTSPDVALEYYMQVPQHTYTFCEACSRAEIFLLAFFGACHYIYLSAPL